MKGFEYIWRYLRGDRKGKEANRLERKALSDPFLYEALEGLEGVPGDHEQVLKGLFRRLQPEVGERRRWKVFRWVAAASVLLVGGVAVWLLAGQDKQEFEQVAAVTQVMKTDSAVPEVAEAVTGTGRAVGAESVEDRKLLRDKAVTAAGEVEKVEVKPEMKAGSGKGEAVSGQVAEDTAEVKNVEEVLKERLKNIDARKMASGSRSGVRIRGMEPQRQQPPRREIKEPQKKEGVIAYDAGRKRNRKGKSVASLATDWSKKSEGDLTWQQRFERYVADSLRYPEAAQLAGVEGEVRLSVRLNKKGHPSRIRILQGVTPECDREAVRLVEEYPGVLGDGQVGKIELTISFRLKETP